jgi:hypothetical protein
MRRVIAAVVLRGVLRGAARGAQAVIINGRPGVSLRVVVCRAKAQTSALELCPRRLLLVVLLLPEIRVVCVGMRRCS